MNYDIPQQVPQRSDGTQDTENHRIAEIADELERLCKVHETQFGVSKTNVNHLETEQRVAEQMAKARGFWIPMMDVFNLGVPGPSGNENDTYVADNGIYKVNNLLNSGSLVSLLRKVLLRYKMRYLSFSQWKYQNRLVEVCEQTGFAKSSKGEFSVTYRYNDKLGLVEAVYDFNHEIQIRLSLIDVVKGNLNRNELKKNYSAAKRVFSIFAAK